MTLAFDDKSKYTITVSAHTAESVVNWLLNLESEIEHTLTCDIYTQEYLDIQAKSLAEIKQSIEEIRVKVEPLNEEPQTNGADGNRDEEFCEWAFGLILKVMPKANKPRNWKAWAVHVRRMRELDNLDYNEMAQVFQWANNDHFWCTNIRSTDKFRKQFAVLHAKMNSGGNNATGQRSTSQRPTRSEKADQAVDEAFGSDPEETETTETDI